MHNYASFGRWLERRRIDLGLTQDALAAAVGCAPRTIRTFERGDRRPPHDLAERLAHALHVPTERRADFVHIALVPASPLLCIVSLRDNHSVMRSTCR